MASRARQLWEKRKAEMPASAGVSATGNNARDAWEEKKRQIRIQNASKIQKVSSWADRYKKLTSGDMGYHAAGEIDSLVSDYDQIKGYADRFGLTDSQKTVDELKNYREYLAGFESEDHYRVMNMSAEELKAELDKGESPVAYTSKDGYNYTWQNLYDDAVQRKDLDNRVQKYSANADWAELGSSDYSGKDFEEAFQQVYSRALSARDPDEAQGLNDLANNLSEMSQYVDHMTEEEKAVLAYMFRTEGAEAATDWFNSRRYLYEGRKAGTIREKNAAYSKAHPIMGSLKALGNTMLSPVEYLADTLRYAGTDEKYYNMSAAQSAAYKQGVTDKYDWKVGNWDAFDFLYNTGMSGVESFAAGTLGGPVGGVALGMSAAAQATNDAFERGMDKKHAMATGIAAGVAEMLFESMSLGNLEKLKDIPSAHVKDIAKNIANSMLVNATEETATELANLAYDDLINGDFSQWETEYRQNIANGMTPEQAKAKAWSSAGWQMAESAASGALMGAGFGVIGSGRALGYNAARAMDTARGQKAAAKDILARDGGVAQLRQLAEETAAAGGQIGRQLEKASAKAGENASRKNVQGLYKTLGKAFTQQDATQVAQALQEKGMDGRTATELARAIVDNTQQKILTDRQNNLLQENLTNPAVQEVIDSVVRNPESEMNQRRAALQGMEGVNSLNRYIRKRDGDSATRVLQNVLTGNADDQQDGQAQESDTALTPLQIPSTEGKVLRGDTAVQIAGVQTAGNGKLTVQLADGSTADSGELSFPDQGTQELYRTVARVADNAEAAKMLIEGYYGQQIATGGDAAFAMTTGDKSAGGVSAGVYARAVEQLVFYGKHQIPMEQLVAESPYVQQLTVAQRNTAYELGKMAGDKAASQRLGAVRKGRSEINRKKGNLHFDGDRGNLTERQSVSLQACEVIAKALGIDVYVFESQRGEDGKRVGDNGWYDPKDGSIHIDLYAGNNSEGVMVFTLAHELTHFIKDWSPVKFRALAGFLAEQYGKQGYSMRDMVRLQQEKAEQDGRNLSFEQAYEEWVADNMETMLTDGKILEKLSMLQAKDASLAGKIKEFLNKFLQRLKAAYNGISAQTKEGLIVSQMVDAAQQLQDLFAEALTDAGNNFQKAEKNTTGEGDVRFCVRNRRLTSESTEQERYNLLKKAKIKLARVNQPAISNVDLETYNTRKKSAVEPGFKELAKKLEILNVDLNNSKISFAFQFSGRSLGISLHHQLEYGGTYQDYVKAMSCFNELVKNAVPIEVHKEKKKGTRRENRDLVQTYVLVSAYLDGKEIVPVQFEVKEFRERDNKLYMTVVLTKIDPEVVDAGVPGKTGNVPHLLSGSNISLRYLFKNVNEKDGRFLKYVPDGFLNDRQKEAKRKALQRQEEEYASYDNPISRASTRDQDGISPRELLVRTVEGMVANSKEWEKLQEYRKKIKELNAAEAKVERLGKELQKLYFPADGQPRDNEMIQNLQRQRDEAIKLLNKYDSQLLNLENTKPIRDIVKRMREASFREGFQKAKTYYREKSEAREQKLHQDFRESRRAAVERHDKAQIRQSIRKDVERLNSLLNKGNKQKNVKQELKEFAGIALRTAQGHFLKNYNEYDMVRNGLTATMNREQQQIFQRCRELMAELDQIRDEKNAEPGADNLHDKWDPEAELRREDREEALKKELAKNMAILREAGIFRTENELMEDSGADQLLDELLTAYQALKDSELAHVRGVYSDVIYGQIEGVKKFLAGKAIKDMTAVELKELQKMYRLVLHTISTSNELFAQKRKADVRKLGEEVITQLQTEGKAMTPELLDRLKKMGWSMLKPETALELIGSDTLTEMMQGLYRGEDTYARDIEDGRKFAAEQAQKYGRKNWDMEKPLSFAGTKITLGQAMSLYAYTKRKQAQGHLEGDGFTSSSNVRIKAAWGKLPNWLQFKFIMNATKTHKVSKEMYEQVEKLLTPQQKAYADAMQEYLSKVMGAKGNEVAMQLYGIPLFEETMYFPLKTASEFHEEALGAKTGEVKLKNSGFTKSVQENASNPIVLDDFESVWAAHVDKMSLYHGFVLPMEDFDRVYNYHRTAERDVTDGEGEVYKKELVDTNETVKVGIENKAGKAANEYIETFMQQLNGGVRGDSTEKLFGGMLRNFKKTAVLASLSVAVQQPTAFVRAMAQLDMRDIADWRNWLGKAGKPDGKLVEEMYKYAPVALMKHIGGFDPGIGRRSKDYMIEPKKGVKKWIDNVAGWLPEKMDEMTWTYIWVCTKRQIHRENPQLRVGSKEFCEKAGERFSQIIRDTQVYDSVLTKSQIMRSKKALLQMATAFMNEPMTSMDMYIRSTIQAKRGKISKKQAARTYAAVVGSQILCAAVAAFVYAARDDDEDETYWEKYMSAAIDKAKEGILPWYSIPFVKDVFSIFEGYDVERSDMSLVVDIFQGWKKLSSSNATAWEKLEAFAGSIINLFGIPAKNLSRDLRGIYNTIDHWINPRTTGTKAGMGYAALEGLTGKKASKADQMIRSMAKGDSAHMLRLMATYDTQDSAESAVRSALKDGYLDGKFTAENVVGLLQVYGGLDAEDAQDKIAWYDFQKTYPDSELKESAAVKWVTEIRESGISLEVYTEYRSATEGLESDKDAKGNTISGSKKKKIVAAIHALPLNRQQKDALFLAEGYAESGLDEAPWN